MYSVAEVMDTCGHDGPIGMGGPSAVGGVLAMDTRIIESLDLEIYIHAEGWIVRAFAVTMQEVAESIRYRVG